MSCGLDQTHDLQPKAAISGDAKICKKRTESNTQQARETCRPCRHNLRIRCWRIGCKCSHAPWWRPHRKRCSANLAVALLPDVPAVAVAIIAGHPAHMPLVVAAEIVPMPTVTALVVAVLVAFPLRIVRTVVVVVVLGGEQQCAQVAQAQGAHAASLPPVPMLTAVLLGGVVCGLLLLWQACLVLLEGRLDLLNGHRRFRLRIITGGILLHDLGAGGRGRSLQSRCRLALLTTVPLAVTMSKGQDSRQDHQASAQHHSQGVPLPGV